MAKALSDIGLVGLAVMGQNLALNIADHGFQISVYNRTTEKTEKFAAEHPDTPGGVVGAKTLEEFVRSLVRPRKIVILVQAGKGTDAVIDSLVPLLEKDDIVIDGGNALWTDTIRREKALREKGLRFIGSGVSGGEEGARFGPALMPGGDPAAYRELEPIWNAIAAKVDAKSGRPLLGATPGHPVSGGVPCATYIGENGAGKSTLLRTLAGLLQPTHGSVRVFGDLEPQQARERIGYMSHAPMLYDELTGVENLRYFASLYAGRACLDPSEALRQVNLDPALDRPLGQYSQGMRQRASLARVLISQPELLLLDEPFSNMDVDSARQMVELLARFRHGSRTIVLTTHQRELAAPIADYVITMHAGRIASLEAGNPTL